MDGIKALERIMSQGGGIILRGLRDEGNDHAVEVEEEHDQVKTELGEGLLQQSQKLPPSTAAEDGDRLTFL